MVRLNSRPASLLSRSQAPAEIIAGPAAARIGAAAPRVWIIDYATGRRIGGHQEDYLEALEAAVARWQPRVVAPFRGGKRALSRGGTYIAQLRLFRQLLCSRNNLIVCHTPEFRDLATLAVASLLAGRSGSVGVFVLRRTGAGIVGRDGLKARLLELIVSWMIRSRRLYPVSDSRPALQHWLRRAPGVPSSLVGIPAPLAARVARSEAATAVGLVGRFRLEKGARTYDAVIRTALDLCPQATIRLHLSDGLNQEEAVIAVNLRNAWGADDRVLIEDGHLSKEVYAAQIAACDLIVLPYDVQTYETGTSGVLHDALALGCTVLCSPIAWAAEAFAGHPGVVWLAGTTPEDLRRGLKEGLERAKTKETARNADNSFTEDWSAAIEAAWQLRSSARKGAIHA